MTDLASPALINPGLAALCALFLSLSFLPRRGPARTRRSFALLALLVATFGVMRELLSRPLGGGLSLAAFLSLYLVFYLLGRFDSDV